jgi:hypothetical protein
MKKNKYILLFLAAASLCFTSCKDEFAEINTDSSGVDIDKGDPTYLFAQGVLAFEPQDYPYWFYNAADIYQWTQVGVPVGGVTSSLADGAAFKGVLAVDVLKYVNEIAYSRSRMSAEKSAQYAQYAAALDVLAIYMGIYDSDFIGNVPYTEAGQGVHGGTLTPKYDRVEELYDLWLKKLDEDILVLTTAKDQIFKSSQDVVYNGDVKKWAKLANSLKLKIAARLISQNKAKALTIAKEVANASCGVLDGEADDFMFNKATSSTSSDDYTYHWKNGVLQSIGGSKVMVDFLVKNKDPRVRFIFEKNRWNSKVVQLFFDAKREKDVPHYIMENVDYEVDAKGIYKFKAWKGAGEPWVRYYGLPLDFDAAKNNAQFGDWFDYTIRCKYNDKFTYRPFSMFQREQIQGRDEFTYPTIPGDPAIQDKTAIPWWGMYMTTGEVNLYLAEFALLGATLPQQASVYFDKAIRASVEEQDRLSRNNKVPYYGTTYNYDPNEVVIDLKNGEIETMLANPDYKLTGNKAADLEKVYIQQIIHFSAQLPIELYVTARRSGVPVIGSKILNRVDYTQIPVGNFPRRMSLTQPSPTDLMYQILMDSYKEQGFSVGTGTILNTQRVWQDKGAPQWGAGPKL